MRVSFKALLKAGCLGRQLASDGCKRAVCVCVCVCGREWGRMTAALHRVQEDIYTGEGEPKQHRAYDDDALCKKGCAYPE